MKRYWKQMTIGLLFVILSTTAAFLPVMQSVKAFSDWVPTLGAVGVVVFILAHAVATMLFLPGWIFTLAAGLIYGVSRGTAVALTGTVLGSSAAFLCGRYLVREHVSAVTEGNEKFAAIDRAIGEQGWKIVALLRLSPIVPFNASNYFCGITAVPFWRYVIASAVGMLPGTLLYAYLGGAGKAGLSGEGNQSTLKWLFLGIGLLATILVTIIVARTAKRALKDARAGNR